MVSLKQSYHLCPINWKVNTPCNDVEEKAKVWDTISRVLSHREKRGKTCCCGCWRARQSVILVDWEDHVFDLIGCFSSDVWCDWLQLITCLMWLEVHPRGYHLRRSRVWFDWLHLIRYLMWLATTDHMSNVIGSTSTGLSLEKRFNSTIEE